MAKISGIRLPYKVTRPLLQFSFYGLSAGSAEGALVKVPRKMRKELGLTNGKYQPLDLVMKSIVKYQDIFRLTTDNTAVLNGVKTMNDIAGWSLMVMVAVAVVACHYYPDPPIFRIVLFGCAVAGLSCLINRPNEHAIALYNFILDRNGKPPLQGPVSRFDNWFEKPKH